jgi:hypothetical protein
MQLGEKVLNGLMENAPDFFPGFFEQSLDAGTPIFDLSLSPLIPRTARRQAEVVKIILFLDLRIVVTNGEVVNILPFHDLQIVVTNGERVKILFFPVLQIVVSNAELVKILHILDL